MTIKKHPAKISQPELAMPEPVTASNTNVPWNPLWAIVFVIIIYFVVQAIGGLVISIYPALHHWTSQQSNDWLTSSVIAQFIYVLIAEALTILSVYLFLKHFKRNLGTIGLHWPRWRDGGYGVIAFPIYFIVYAVLVAAVIHLIPSLNINQKQEIGFDSVHGTGALFLTFLSLVILPPITEEILVRGFLFGSLRKHLKFVWASIITSLIFASAHLPEGGSAGPLYIAALDTFTLSLVLCYLREKTGSLWAGILLHALKNGVAFLSLFIIGSR